MTRQEFIELLADKMNDIENFPVLKSLAIAQACLESAFGTKHFYNNLYGIKCWNRNAYAGCRLGRTAEFIDGSYQHNLSLAFQTYHNFDESIEDYVRLMNINRYRPVREAKDYVEATEQIRKCGFATSPTYTANLRRIITQYNLTKYDDTVINANTRLAPNFRLGEFSSRGRLVPPEYMDNVKKVATNLQLIRDHFGKPVYIINGYRSPEHNRAVGGAARSQHLTASAVDMYIVGVAPRTIFNYARANTEFRGFGLANRMIHVDIRKTYTTWTYQ